MPLPGEQMPGHAAASSTRCGAHGAGLSDFRALRSGAASVAAGERASPGHCRRQFHRSLDTLIQANEFPRA